MDISRVRKAILNVVIALILADCETHNIVFHQITVSNLNIFFFHNDKIQTLVEVNRIIESDFTIVLLNRLS